MVEMRVVTLTGEMLQCQIPLGLPTWGPWEFEFTGALTREVCIHWKVFSRDKIDSTNKLR